MTGRDQLLVWRVMAFIFLSVGLVFFVIAMLALNDRDEARRIRASMGALQLNCVPITHVSNELPRSPHEQEDNGPTPAAAGGRWIEERYSL